MLTLTDTLMYLDGDFWNNNNNLRINNAHTIWLHHLDYTWIYFTFSPTIWTVGGHDARRSYALHTCIVDISAYPCALHWNNTHTLHLMMARQWTKSQELMKKRILQTDHQTSDMSEKIENVRRQNVISSSTHISWEKSLMLPRRSLLLLLFWTC